MSIYFGPSKSIRVSDLLDGRLSHYDISVHQLTEDPTRYQVTDGVNSLFLDASDDGLIITTMTRYMCHEVDFIIEALEKSYDVIIYSEYERQYWGGKFPHELEEDDIVEEGGPFTAAEVDEALKWLNDRKRV